MLSRRTLLTGAAGLPLLAGHAGAATTPGHLTFGLSSFPPNLQPWTNTGTAASTAKVQMFRGLLTYDDKGELRGDLADRWEQDGQTAWVFRLREALFHNGAPVTSEDVRWTIEQVAGEKSTAAMRAEFQGVERVETPDPRTVRFVMKQPTVTLPTWLASYFMPIIAKGTPDAPVGAGPFMLKGQERGTSLDFVAFDKYYRPGLPKLKTLRMVAYADETARVAALRAGDVDLIEYVPWQSMADIQADPRLRLDTVNGPCMYLTFNSRTGPFADPRLRNAVAFAIKRDEIVKAAFFGRGAPMGGLPIPDNSPYFDKARANHWTYDPARARALLKEAGQEGGFAATLLSTAQYGMHKDTAEIVQQNLADIGVKVTLNLPDWASRVALGNRGQFEFSVMGTAPDSNDPDALSSLIDGQLPPSFIRSVGIGDTRLHDLMAQGRAEFDAAKRRAIYAQAEQAALDQAPFVGLAWRSQGYAMTRAVQGFTNLPGALTFYSGVTLDTTTTG